MVNEIMEDYLETWTILRGRIKRITKKRAFLFPNWNDYEEWLNSTANASIAGALKNLEKWDRKYPFHHFAFLRARAMVRDELKAEGDFRCAVRAEMVKETPDLPEYGHTPIESLLDCDEANWALAQMSPDQVEALALRYEADLPVKEIARLMERSANAVSVLIHRGKERLETLIGRQAKSAPKDMPPDCVTPSAFSRGFRPQARGQVDDEDGPPSPSLWPLPSNVIPFPQQRRSI